MTPMSSREPYQVSELQKRSGVSPAAIRVVSFWRPWLLGTPWISSLIFG